MKSHRTRSLFVVAFGHLAIELCSSFLPVLYPILISNMGLSYTQIGIIAMVAGIGTSLAQPLFGYLSDLWGPHRISVLGVMWIGLIMGTVGWISSYALIVLVVGLGVLGSAAFHPAAATIVSASGGTRRGAAASVFSVGGNLGAALSPLWVTAGVHWLGLRGTLVLVPVALLGSALLYRQLIHQAPPTRERPRNAREPLRGRALAGLVLIVLTVMCISWFQVAFKTYLPIWIEGQGETSASGGQMLTVLLASAGVGGLIGGPLSDRLGRWQLLALSLSLLGPVEWLFLGATGALQVVLVAAIGLLCGSTFPVTVVAAQEIWPSGVGIASGLAMGLGWLPGGFGASLTGVVADRTSLTAGLRLLALPAALGALCSLAYAVVCRTRSTQPGSE